MVEDLYESKKARKFKLIDKKLLLLSSIGASIAGFGSAIVTASWQLANYGYEAFLYFYTTKSFAVSVESLRETMLNYSQQFFSSVFNSFVVAFVQNLAGYYASLKIISHYLSKIFGDSNERRA